MYEDTYEDELITFSLGRWENEVVINWLEIELKFTREEFCSYFNLVAICFMDILPHGSIIELDGNFLGEEQHKELRLNWKIREKDPILLRVTARLVPVEEYEEYIDEYGEQALIEYEVVQYPVALGNESLFWFVNRTLIKRVVNRDFNVSNEDIADTQKLKKEYAMSDRQFLEFVKAEKTDQLIAGIFEKSMQFTNQSQRHGG